MGAVDKRDRRDPDGHSIYRHTCLVNGKCYIGQTEYGAKRRWVQHMRAAEQGSPLLLHKAIRKYGQDAFGHVVLEMVRTRDEANAAERRWIAYFKADKPATGYNLDAGGTAHNTAETTRQKIGAAHRLRWSKMTQADRSAAATITSSAMSKEERRAATLSHWHGLTRTEQNAQVTRLNAARTPEERSNATRQWRAGLTPQQRENMEAKRLASTAPEQRTAAAKQRAQTLGPIGLQNVAAKIAAAWVAHSPEEKRAITHRREAGKSAHAADTLGRWVRGATKEELSERTRRSNASRTAEQRRQSALDREARKRASRGH